jgi:hypothetical protein
MLRNWIHALARRSYESRQSFMGLAQLELQIDVWWGIVPTRLSRASG